MNTTNAKLAVNKPITPESLSPEKDESNLVTRMAVANELANNPEAVKDAFKYGNTPVVYLPTREMLRPAQTPGLLEYIRNAKTVKEVENLVKRIPKFEHASPGTIRKWHKAATKRTAELETLVKPVQKVRKTAKTKKA